MGVVVGYTIQSPILHRALNGVPEMKLRNPAIYPEPDGFAKALLWVCGDDFRTFEGNLRDHSMVADHECLTRVDGYRFYTVSHVEGAESNLSYPLVFENDIQVLDATGTQAGLEMKALCPTKSAFSRYRNGCRDRDIPFRLRSLYYEDGDATEGRVRPEPGSLTETQRETLLTALAAGYFDVPRRATLEEIADRLDISTQAVSTRLRRGQRNLIRTTLRTQSSYINH